jgi:hypothetical protein
MKIRRLIFIFCTLVTAAVVICVVVVFHLQRSQPVFKGAQKLTAAVHMFSQDLASQGKQLPESVSLQELISGGYLATNDVHAFDGMDVTISLSASDAYPQSILIHVRMPDGTQIVAMADGSVQQVPK